jgi:hypothetical protein
MDVLNGAAREPSTDTPSEILVAADPRSVEGRIEGRDSTVVLVPIVLSRPALAHQSQKVASGVFRFVNVPLRLRCLLRAEMAARGGCRYGNLRTASPSASKGQQDCRRTPAGRVD